LARAGHAHVRRNSVHPNFLAASIVQKSLSFSHIFGAHLFSRLILAGTQHFKHQ